VAKQDSSEATFEARRSILQNASPSLKDRTGRPLFVAAVQTRKNYVSYHLIPV
jgi:hypothetical protein